MKHYIGIVHFSLFYENLTPLVHLISHIPNKQDKYAYSLTLAKVTS